MSPLLANADDGRTGFSPAGDEDEDEDNVYVETPRDRGNDVIVEGNDLGDYLHKMMMGEVDVDDP